jgi:hypothetical protein
MKVYGQLRWDWAPGRLVAARRLHGPRLYGRRSAPFQRDLL